MGTGLTGGLYRLLLLLHILCVVLGFGAVSFNGLYRVRARQRGGEAELVLLEENAYVTRTAEFLIYGVFVFGILVALTSKKAWEFSQSWLSVAMLLYLIEIGVVHGVIHRSERQYKTLLGQVNAAGPGGRPPEVTQLEQLEKRIRMAWNGFNLVFLVILYLMVFTPGQVRAG
ncbi:MAG: DUF2269 family protein [Actinomycetota bacterium]|nr:DUF2269 family protein [Actinomycetota bacterium]